MALSLGTTSTIFISSFITCDYVFDKKYKLMPLKELEEYVKENNHLPNIPKASETDSNGLDVSDMISKQLEKIEELYKYIIEMNKNMEKLSDENKALKERMTILDKK